jgi:hypothetical protein
MNDKRRNRRFDIDQKLWCEGQELHGPATAKNMSRGGMAIIADENAEIGTRMKVSFVTPDEGDVSVNMEVVWRDDKPSKGPVAMGLRVVKFDKGHDAFDRFVNDHLSGLPPGKASLQNIPIPTEEEMGSGNGTDENG